jgi:hypothetical protein
VMTDWGCDMTGLRFQSDWVPWAGGNMGELGAPAAHVMMTAPPLRRELGAAAHVMMMMTGAPCDVSWGCSCEDWNSVGPLGPGLQRDIIWGGPGLGPPGNCVCTGAANVTK